MQSVAAVRAVSVLYVPAAHARQLERAVRAVSVLYVPAGHARQAAALVCSASALYVPAGQAVQDAPFWFQLLFVPPQMQRVQDRERPHVAAFAFAL